MPATPTQPSRTKCAGSNQLDDATCRCLLKAWLLAGMTIPEDEDSGKANHMNLQPRLFDKRPERRTQPNGVGGTSSGLQTD